jgi:hypothetical protein
MRTVISTERGSSGRKIAVQTTKQWEPMAANGSVE